VALQNTCHVFFKKEFVFQGFFISYQIQTQHLPIKGQVSSSLLPITLAHQRFFYILKKNQMHMCNFVTKSHVCRTSQCTNANEVC